MPDPHEPAARRTIHFRCGDDVIPITIASDISEPLADHCAARRFDRLFLVADRNVWRLYGDALRSALAATAPAEINILEPSEEIKRLPTVQRLLEAAIEKGVTRRSAVIAFGGGLVGNIAGMAAALLYRGVTLLHLPTTLLAMTDSILSLKQAVNAEGGKNLFGLYYLPERAFIGTRYLSTLGGEHVAGALIEFVKNCLAFDPANTRKLVSLLQRKDREKTWGDLIALGIEAKQKLLRDDPHERGKAIVLEYGHTVGHALEHQDYGLNHGIAVGLGMLVAAAISRARGWLSDREYRMHFDMIRTAGGLLELPPDLDVGRTVARIGCDNKHGYLDCEPGCHPFVLLERAGQPAFTDGLPLARVSEDEILEAIHEVQNAAEST